MKSEGVEALAKRTAPSDGDFLGLVAELDAELWAQYPDSQGEYVGLNKLPEDALAMIVMYNDSPVACGSLKSHGDASYELKRIFVKKAFRGRGLSKLLLSELEAWARERGAARIFLETGFKQLEAISLYEKTGFARIENFGEYKGKATSLCMRKYL
jgi:putative acetyltransferase